METKPIQPSEMCHSFWLLDSTERPNWENSDLLVKDAQLHISDDILFYFYDYLQWVPTFNPVKRMEEGFGLNRYGPTVVIGNGASKFHDIFNSIVNLYRHGPEDIILTGDWGVTLDENGEEMDDGHYEKYHVRKEHIIESFSLLALWGREASKNNCYIFHCGK